MPILQCTFKKLLFFRCFVFQADSLSSENSDSSGEDWLIKVRCPGARHRYSKRAHAKKVNITILLI